MKIKKQKDQSNIKPKPNYVVLNLFTQGPYSYLYVYAYLQKVNWVLKSRGDLMILIFIKDKRQAEERFYACTHILRLEQGTGVPLSL